jgi:hypothetical protein
LSPNGSIFHLPAMESNRHLPIAKLSQIGYMNQIWLKQVFRPNRPAITAAKGNSR